MKTMWKQSTGLHPSFTGINRSLEDDWFLLPHELRLQRAHARALGAATILSDAEVAALEKAIDAIGEAHSGKPCPDSDAEDIHTWIETELTARAGDAGRKIHTARSRNDQVATLLRLFVIDAGQHIAGDLAAWMGALCTQAKAWADDAFPLHTHQQFAAPGSPAFWTLRFAANADHVRRHLLALIDLWKQECPLGSGAVAGSSIPIDRHRQATELGFAGPSLNALASTGTRDDCVELLAIQAQIALHMQSFATDVIIFGQTPLGWVQYPAAFGTGSSMMPNKTNPDAMELLRGECNAILTAHQHATWILKGLPSGYNRDLQCIKPVVRDATAKLRRLLAMVTPFTAALAFDRERMAASLSQGAIDATLRMEALVRDGMPMRDAHHQVADAVRQGTAAQGTAPSLSAYATSGSASPAEVRRVADLLLERV